MSKGREPPTENPRRRRQRPAGAVPAGAGSAAALELCLSPPPKCFRAPQCLSAEWPSHVSPQPALPSRQTAALPDILSCFKQGVFKEDGFHNPLEKRGITDRGVTDSTKRLGEGEDAAGKVFFRRAKALDCSDGVFKAAPASRGMLWGSCNSPAHLSLCPGSPGKLGELLERVLTNTFDGFNKCLLSGIPSTSDRVPARANRSKQRDSHFLLAAANKTARETARSVISAREPLASL